LKGAEVWRNVGSPERGLIPHSDNPAQNTLVTRIKDLEVVLVVPTEIVTGEAQIIIILINVDVEDFLILTDVEVRGLNQFPAERIFSQFLCGVVVDVHKSNVVLNIRAALVKDNFLEKLCDLFVSNHIFLFFYLSLPSTTSSVMVS